MFTKVKILATKNFTCETSYKIKTSVFQPIKLLLKVEMPINFNLGLRTAYKLQIDRCHKNIVMESRM